MQALLLTREFLANLWPFVKVFSHQSFPLYSISICFSHTFVDLGQLDGKRFSEEHGFIYYTYVYLLYVFVYCVI